MKRSVLITKTAEAVRPILNNSGLNLTTIGAEMLVSVVLKEFEKLGMKPPVYVFRDGDMGTNFRNEWEVEND